MPITFLTPLFVFVANTVESAVDSSCAFDFSCAAIPQSVERESRLKHAPQTTESRSHAPAWERLAPPLQRGESQPLRTAAFPFDSVAGGAFSLDSLFQGKGGKGKVNSTRKVTGFPLSRERRQKAKGKSACLLDPRAVDFSYAVIPKSVNRESRINMRRRHPYRFIDSVRLSAGVHWIPFFKGKTAKRKSQKKKRLHRASYSINKLACSGNICSRPNRPTKGLAFMSAMPIKAWISLLHQRILF